MAKITCPQCLAQIDEKEDVCPQCGAVLADKIDGGSQVYVEERSWTFGNTLVALLLSLLIIALGVFLYLHGLKWPYEDAKKYYNDEKAAYEQQVSEYYDFCEQISAANAGLNESIDSLRKVLNSGEEPLDPGTATNAREAIRLAEELRVEVPVIEAEAVPVPAKDDIFHAKEIRETGRIIDQQRYGLYQRYSSLQVPDYSSVISAVDRMKTELQNSIRQRRETENVSPQLKKLLDEYQSFMDEYITFMAIYDRSSPEQIQRGNELQKQLVAYVREIEAIDSSKLSEPDLNYYTIVTESIARQMAENNLLEPEVL